MLNVRIQNEKQKTKQTTTYILSLVQRANGNHIDVVHEHGIILLHAAVGIHHQVLHKNADGTQHEGHKQVHMNIVSGAVKTPAKRINDMLLPSCNPVVQFTRLRKHFP